MSVRATRQRRLAGISESEVHCSLMPPVLNLKLRLASESSYKAFYARRACQST
jgi:hypothetical protein